MTIIFFLSLSFTPYFYSTLGTDIDVCNQEQDSGPCGVWELKFYYNKNTRQCDQFYYGGCGGNGNRFSSENECQSICISREEPVVSKG